MKKSVSILMLGFVLSILLVACVTINIYFPAAAADKAADKIIDDVWQIKNDQNKDSSTKDVSPTPTPAPVTAPATETK
jgi:cytoskeletal protein RodZ